MYDDEWHTTKHPRWFEKRGIRIPQSEETTSGFVPPFEDGALQQEDSEAILPPSHGRMPFSFESQAGSPELTILPNKGGLEIPSPLMLATNRDVLNTTSSPPGSDGEGHVRSNSSSYPSEGMRSPEPAVSPPSTFGRRIFSSLGRITFSNSHLSLLRSSNESQTIFKVIGSSHSTDSAKSVAPEGAYAADDMLKPTVTIREIGRSLARHEPERQEITTNSDSPAEPAQSEQVVEKSGAPSSRHTSEAESGALAAPELVEAKPAHPLIRSQSSHRRSDELKTTASPPKIPASLVANCPRNPRKASPPRKTLHKRPSILGRLRLTGLRAWLSRKFRRGSKPNYSKPKSSWPNSSSPGIPASNSKRERRPVAPHRSDALRGMHRGQQKKRERVSTAGARVGGRGKASKGKKKSRGFPWVFSEKAWSNAAPLFAAGEEVID